MVKFRKLIWQVVNFSIGILALMNIKMVHLLKMILLQDKQLWKLRKL
nr:MAG TPA: ATP synthase subunit alpha [Caudoviricetes sp.]